MIETPAAALLADRLAAVADFLSIGTNDLTQYTLAMDRGHPQLAARLDALHPAVLRLIAARAQAAHAHGRPVAVCGGLASEPLAAPLLDRARRARAVGGAGGDRAAQGAPRPLHAGAVPRARAARRSSRRHAAAVRALLADDAARGAAIMKGLLAGLQQIGGALMLPIAVLPIAALLLRLGQPDLLDSASVAAAGEAIFANLGLLFADRCRGGTGARESRRGRPGGRGRVPRGHARARRC